MESIKEIYKIGKGPSSSHTMGPKKAAEMFKGMYPGASSFTVTLYGSLAATGKGHMTDVALIEALKDERSPRVDIIWKPDVFLPCSASAAETSARTDDASPRRASIPTAR